jgi:glutamate--cysteine ligase
MAATSSLQAPAKRLTKQDLVDYLGSGCSPPDEWRIGTEHEKLAIKAGTTQRAGYEEIRHILQGLVDRFGWRPITESGKIIGCELDGQSVTLEPGGQFELSGAPVSTLHQTCAEVNQHLYQVKTLADEVGVRFLTIGFDPRSATEEVPIMPKARYDIMRAYMPTVGSLGLDMMLRSTTIQVNVDFEDEADMVQMARLGIALQPIATALFANSPFRDGKPTGYLSWRSHVWTDTDPDRCGILPFIFDEDFGFERYAEYALDVPMYFVNREGRYISAAGQSFRDFMEGKLPALPGDYPSLKDWETHLTTIFPEIRLKRYLEMRGADGGPWTNICALPALWVGIFYDKGAQAEAAQLVADWTLQDMADMREQVPRLALKTPFRDGTIQDVAKQVLAISRRGLQARGNAEEKFLAPLEAIAESGVTLAEQMLQRYEGGWGGDVSHAYDESDFQY